jgi:hypothetical protein
MKKTLTIAGVISTCLLALGYLLIDPSDESMKAEFMGRRQQFEDLYRMAIEDGHLWRMSNSWYREKNGRNYEAASGLLSDERWRSYRRAFSTLRLEAGISIEDGNVFFIRSSSGLAVSGSSQGFARLKEKPQQNQLCENLHEEGTCYSPLIDDWYIFHSAT